MTSTPLIFPPSSRAHSMATVFTQDGHLLIAAVLPYFKTSVEELVKVFTQKKGVTVSKMEVLQQIHLFGLFDRTFIMMLYEKFEVTCDDIAFAISPPENGINYTDSQIAEQYDKLRHRTDTGLNGIKVYTAFHSDRNPKELPNEVLKGLALQRYKDMMVTRTQSAITFKKERCEQGLGKLGAELSDLEHGSLSANLPAGPCDMSVNGEDLKARINKYRLEKQSLEDKKEQIKQGWPHLRELPPSYCP